MSKLRNALILTALLSAAPLMSAQPAFAKSSKRYTATLPADVEAIAIKVVIGDELQYRADHLSKDIRDRANSHPGLRNGFAGAGYYGQKELDRLAKRLKSKTKARLIKAGVKVDDNAQNVLVLTLTDARPNRPTFNQLSKDTSLSLRSFGVGGAAIEGVLQKAGEDAGNVSYAWYETDIRDAYTSGTWTDANTAIDRFARKTAKVFKN
ncbi:MAG TPA: hypothetical protein ENJ42_06510 [Hellea balneolensis]|uniref:DUF3313 domain-containing protein n=1 Tax=Hellea balneolensis TaxID=287478 RepID=A0A7C5LUK9_9PROT|nr:hypothetical protein [Hellea balneolensis]